ncbi:YqeG family HAD IIIA-type phosphatase [Ornithinibacillus sp. 4-3]|uniref:YqeG family HAD IIIA-type phosphatase n=1 Tax=Ornithinibacillus sp. 4-3 TaxID=3231488 RepID=A0AB39HJ66_9BACI
MYSRFLPNTYVKSIFDIDPVFLKENGIRGIITDLDNTLIPWNVQDASAEIIKWFKQLEANNIKVTVISNNNENRVKVFSDPLKVPYIANARKPLKRSFKQAAKLMGLCPGQVAVIGDQLLTDILGGNSAGFYTILVAPIVQTDAKITQINRTIERRIMERFRKKGIFIRKDEQ